MGLDYDREDMSARAALAVTYVRCYHIMSSLDSERKVLVIKSISHYLIRDSNPHDSVFNTQ